MVFDSSVPVDRTGGGVEPDGGVDEEVADDDPDDDQGAGDLAERCARVSMGSWLKRNYTRRGLKWFRGLQSR